MPESQFATKQQLARFLSQLETFTSANVALEQYPTEGEIAADLLWRAYLSGHIAEKRVADLGCGTGILGIGALALGAAHVTFIDIDHAALAVLQRNLARLPNPAATIRTGDLTLLTESVDTIVQNPPFGTRERGADSVFLVHALRHARAVFSLHKASTLDHLRRIVEREGATLVQAIPYSFPLKRTMAHHRKRIERIEVVCLEISTRSSHGSERA